MPELTEPELIHIERAAERAAWKRRQYLIDRDRDLSTDDPLIAQEAVPELIDTIRRMRQREAFAVQTRQAAILA